MEAGLRDVLEHGSFGTTDFAAGMRKALRAFSETPPESEETRRLILFVAEQSDPLVPSLQKTYAREYARKDVLMKKAALEAIETDVRVYTFGVGPAALDTPPHALVHIAGATGGRYDAVLDPSQLHCRLLEALAPPAVQARRRESGPSETGSE